MSGLKNPLEASGLAQSAELPAALAEPAVEFAKCHPLIGAGLADHSRGGDIAGDIGGAAHYRLMSKDWDQPFVRVDAIL